MSASQGHHDRRAWAHSRKLLLIMISDRPEGLLCTLWGQSSSQASSKHRLRGGLVWVEIEALILPIQTYRDSTLPTWYAGAYSFQSKARQNLTWEELAWLTEGKMLLEILDQDAPLEPMRHAGWQFSQTTCSPTGNMCSTWVNWLQTIQQREEPELWEPTKDSGNVCPKKGHVSVWYQSGSAFSLLNHVHLRHASHGGDSCLGRFCRNWKRSCSWVGGQTSNIVPSRSLRSCSAIVLLQLSWMLYQQQLGHEGSQAQAEIDGKT